jgi:hypothetical protein
MIRILVIILGMLLLTSQLFAQSRTITGKVTDDKEMGLSNASIIVKGTT